MRANFVQNTSTTGGTSTLTLSGVTGSPGFTDVFGTSGTRTVEYVIREYTDSAHTELSLAETGVGSIALSTGVLTRSLVTSTWNASTSAYLPKPGVATAPTALSFGTTAANIRVELSLAADGLLPYGHDTANTEGIGGFAITGNSGPSALNMTNQLLTYWYFPYCHSRRPISTVTIRNSAGYTGGTSSYHIGIYAVGTDGFPAEQLADFGSLGSIASGNITSAALTNPIPPPTAGYYVATLPQFSGGSGTPQFMIMGGAILCTTPLGLQLGSGGARHFNSATKTGQTSLPSTAVGTSPTAAQSGPAPYFGFK